MKGHRLIFGFLLGAFAGASFLFSLYNFVYSGKILPHIFIAAVDVSGLTREGASAVVFEKYEEMKRDGIRVFIDGNAEAIDPKNIDLTIPTDVLAKEAWLFGRKGSAREQLQERISAFFSLRVLSSSISVNEEKLASEIGILAHAYDVPVKDMRYDIEGTKVHILYDVKPGKILDQEKARKEILSHIANLDTSSVNLSLDVRSPKADPAFGNAAKREAERILRSAMVLTYNEQRFIIGRETLGSFITSYYDGAKLVPGFDRKQVSEYVVGLAEKINTAPENPRVKVENGKVIEFTAPRQGRALLQNDTVEMIMGALKKREFSSETTNELSLPVVIKKPIGEGSARDLGIFELIGKAATPFTGSPKNRIHNLTNGARFLSGILVPPKEEFSTLASLGAIDNSTGYLPELVIKGDETIPEFGGGLCQVSTTLFRAVMNAGLPVTQRRNHSYRVPYYEKDSEGRVIGPGLDATIYSPAPDFRFKNDTKFYVLIQGFVEGDKITFEIYGTSDGRKSVIDGPRTLMETPAGEPIYIETDTLAKGETKKIDTAH
ncbi:MAG: VanW family protein, partial [Candidatus Spechtbacteria bacterium]|nr:VanW family protein [Candidatus Spechtbacteria bacterium]